MYVYNDKNNCKTTEETDKITMQKLILKGIQVAAVVDTSDLTKRALMSISITIAIRAAQQLSVCVCVKTIHKKTFLTSIYKNRFTDAWITGQGMEAYSMQYLYCAKNVFPTPKNESLQNGGPYKLLVVSL